MGRSVVPKTRDARAYLRPRISKPHLHLVSASVTPRDIRICLSIFEHRFLTTLQAKRLFFRSHPRARDRLLKLHRMRVLDRFRPRKQLGSFPWHYVLDEVGVYIVASYKGIAPKDLDYDREAALALVFSPRLAHMSEVNDFFSALSEAAAERGFRLGQWWSERHCAANWKGFVRPDGLGRIEGGEVRVSFFLELDGGTEPYSRLQSKLNQYATVAGMPDSPEALLFCFPNREREAGARKVLGHCGLTVATAILGDHLREPMARIWLPIPSDRRLSVSELGGRNGRTTNYVGKEPRYDRRLR